MASEGGLSSSGQKNMHATIAASLHGSEVVTLRWHKAPISLLEFRGCYSQHPARGENKYDCTRLPTLARETPVPI